MKTYEVQIARIAHHLYFLVVKAENEDEAREIAREQFHGDEYSVLAHSEEFVHNVEETTP